MRLAFKNKTGTKLPHSGDTQAGFTLVEMLIALFIFSLIATATFSAMTTSLKTQSRLERLNEDMAAQMSARALIMSDMRHLTLRPVRDPLGNFEPNMLSSGIGDLLSFTRDGRPNPGGLERRGDLQRVRYGFKDGQLIREVLQSANPAPRTPKIVNVLYENVEAVRIRFADENQTYDRLAIDAREFDKPVSPNISMMTLDIRFNDGRQLVQKFEVSL